MLGRLMHLDIDVDGIVIAVFGWRLDLDPGLHARLSSSWFLFLSCVMIVMGSVSGALLFLSMFAFSFLCKLASNRLHTEYWVEQQSVITIQAAGATQARFAHFKTCRFLQYPLDQPLAISNGDLIVRICACYSTQATALTMEQTSMVRSWCQSSVCNSW